MSDSLPIAQNDAVCCGAQPPYSVSYIDPKVCGGNRDQWFVMGTVDGHPRNGCGPVAICEYEPSAHVIAALLNASGGCVTALAAALCDRPAPTTKEQREPWAPEQPPGGYTAEDF